MAAPTYRGKGVYAAGTTSFVCDIDGITGHASGDLLLIIMESTDSTTAAGTPTTPTDWTKIFEFTGSPGVTGVSTLTVFAKIHDGSEADVTIDGVGNHCSGTMFAVQAGTHGVTNVATDIVVGTGTDHGTGTTGLSTSGITVTADSLIFHIVGLTDDALDTTNVSNVANANLASITEREDNATNQGTGGGIGVTTATCAGTTTGATTWDHDTGAVSESVHIGIKPTAGGAVSGSAASTVNVTSAADGDVAVQGASASVVNLTQAADGDVLVQGAAASVVNLTQAADGDVTVQGAAATVINLTQAATGTVEDAGPGDSEGEAASILNVTSAGTGTVVVQGAGASVVQIASVVDADLLVQGAASTSVSVQQAAEADLLAQGAAASFVSLSGEATGAVAVLGIGTSLVNATSEATGVLTNPPSGAAATVLQVISSATGTTPFVEPPDQFNSGRPRYPGPLWKRKRMYL